MIIKVDFRLTYPELREIRKLTKKIKPRPKKGFWQKTVIPPIVSAIVAVVLVAATIVGGSYALFVRHDSESIKILLIALAVIAYAGGSAIWSHYQFKKKAEQASNRNYEATEKNLTVHTEVSHHVFEWLFFVQFVETERFYFLFFNEGEAFVLPKRAFASPEEAKAFGDLAQAGITHTQGFPVAPVAPQTTTTSQS